MTESEHTTTHTRPAKKSFLSKLILFVLFLALVGSIAWGAWSYKMYLDAKSQITKLTSLEGQQELAQIEIEAIVSKLSKHMILPEGEVPAVATITDADELAKEQPFYTGATNGDKIIVYSEAKKAILYSVEKDLIINVGPIFLDEDQQSQQQQQPSQIQPAASPVPQVPSQENEPEDGAAMQNDEPVPPVTTAPSSTPAN